MQTVTLLLALAAAGCEAFVGAPSVRSTTLHIHAPQPRLVASGDGAASKPRKVVLEDTTEGSGELDSEKKKQIAKARRAVQSQGKGGMKVNKGKKRSEQKKAVSGRGFGKVTGALNYDRKPSADTPCACGSCAPYGECCAPLHEGRASATTPAALVRARYTSYVYRLPDYLIKTTDPSGEEFQEDTAKWKKGLLSFCDDFDFQGLKLDDADAASAATGDTAVVGFRANFCQKGSINLMALREFSTFRRSADDGSWLYSAGDVSYEAQEA